MSLEGLMRTRSAAAYADFVLPLIGDRDRVLDVGCGPGSITLGLAAVAHHVIGVDPEDAEFTEARTYASEHGVDNVEFREGTIYQLHFPDASFDVCTLFSMLETLDDPLAGLAEVRRVLRPGGLIGASSVEYGGLIPHGPDESLLRRFYELRLRLWEAQGDHYHRGRELRVCCWQRGSSRWRPSPGTSATGPRSSYAPLAWAGPRTAGTNGSWAGSRSTDSATPMRSSRWNEPGSAGLEHRNRSPPSRGAARSDVVPSSTRARFDCSIPNPLTAGLRCWNVIRESRWCEVWMAAASTPGVPGCSEVCG